MAEATTTGVLIPVPPAGLGIRLWALSAYVAAATGIAGHIDIPIGNEHNICQVGQSLNLVYAPAGLFIGGTDVVVNTAGTIVFSITALYDETA